MTDGNLQAGVVGLGVGAQHVRSYAAIDGVDVRAICDIDPARLDAVGKKWGVPERYTDYRRITEHPEIDVVSICSYDDAHAEQALSAFRHGKHVMVEKPVCLTRAEAETLLRAQQDSGCLITSNLILRRSPRFQELREQIRAGHFGKIFYVEGDYVHDILWKITEGWRGRMDFYCVIFGGGIHMIDLMRWLLGEEIIEVASIGNDLRTQGSSYKYDDCITSMLRFESGATGKTLTTYGPRRIQIHALNVYGSERTFINDIPHAKTFDGDRPENERIVSTPYPGVEKGDLLPDFVSAIRTGREPDVGAHDVFRVMDVCLTARDALEAKRTLTVNYQI